MIAERHEASATSKIHQSSPLLAEIFLTVTVIWSSPLSQHIAGVSHDWETKMWYKTMRQDQVIISVKGAYPVLARVEHVASVRRLLNWNPERDLEIGVWLPFLKTYLKSSM
jgi:hypothetical protein